MSVTTQTGNDWLNLILNGIAIPNIADNASVAPLTNLYISLHVATPGVAGAQNTNEAAYTGYARQPVARTPGSPAWTVGTSLATPNAAITFPTATAGSETETFMGIGTSLSGAGKLLWFGSISPSIAVSAGVQPQLTTSTTITAT